MHETEGVRERQEGKISATRCVSWLTTSSRPSRHQLMTRGTVPTQARLATRS
ncbi:unnamed protein product [Ectocarpus sp. CCAP 1310/34]|nr:unnamed protein product [Ectocarpus sp. CCAP 1310/34]